MEGLENFHDLNFEEESVDMKRFGNNIKWDSDEKGLANIMSNESSYVGKKLTTDVRVPGNICKPEFYNYWKKTLLAPEFVLETLRDGYKFPLSQTPPPSFEPNNRSALNERKFMIAELMRLEKLEVISKVIERPHLVLPLSVVFSKKLRLVVDASRALNPYIEAQKINLEDLRI